MHYEQLWGVHNKQCSHQLYWLFLGCSSPCKSSPTLGNSGRVKSIENSVQRTHYERRLMKEDLGTIPVLRQQNDRVSVFFENGNFFWRSVLYSYWLSGWVGQKKSKLCWSNRGMVFCVTSPGRGTGIYGFVGTGSQSSEFMGKTFQAAQLTLQLETFSP